MTTKNKPLKNRSGKVGLSIDEEMVESLRRFSLCDDQLGPCLNLGHEGGGREGLGLEAWLAEPVGDFLPKSGFFQTDPRLLDF